MFRLVGESARQRWVHLDAGADLWVFTAGTSLTEQLLQTESTPVLLAFGDPDARTQHHLGRPLRATELLPMLNQIGDLLVIAKTSAPAATPSVSSDRFNGQSGSVIAPPSPIAKVDRPANEQRGVESTAAFRIQRWPPPALTVHPAQIRLATILLGKPETIDGLIRRSGQPHDVCTDYLNALDAAGYLVAVRDSVASDGSSSERAAPSIFANTSRNFEQESFLQTGGQRPLGAAATSVAAPVAAPSSSLAPPAATPATHNTASNKPTLFQRIRSRLAQQIAGKT